MKHTPTRRSFLKLMLGTAMLSASTAMGLHRSTGSETNPLDQWSASWRFPKQEVVWMDQEISLNSHVIHFDETDRPWSPWRRCKGLVMPGQRPREYRTRCATFDVVEQRWLPMTQFRDVGK